MDVYEASTQLMTVRVVTLSGAERFAVSAPGTDDPYRVHTVTAFGENPWEPPYFTVAGDRLADGEFAELETHFTDAGVLPPHVREVVESVVPVVDSPAVVRNPSALKQSGGPGTYGGRVLWPGADVVARREARRAEFELGEFNTPPHAELARVVPFPVSPVNPYRGRV